MYSILHLLTMYMGSTKNVAFIIPNISILNLRNFSNENLIHFSIEIALSCLITTNISIS